MKKYILLMVSAIMFAFTSCTDSEEIDIKYQVNVTVNPSTVLNSFNGYSVGGEIYGLDMDENSKLLITSLIYDENGDLIDKKENLVTNYNYSSTFSLNMSTSDEYTVVAITYSRDMALDVDAYTIGNEDRLDRLTVTSNYGSGISYHSNWTILGVATTKISTKIKENTINIEPASAMIVIRYHDIHAFDEYGVDTHWIAYKNNNQATFNTYGNLDFKSTSATNSGYFSSLDVTNEPRDITIIEFINLLPTSNMEIWGGFNIGDTEFDYSEFLEDAGLDSSLGVANIDIEAGKEYYFDVYCGEFAIAVGKMSRTSSVDSFEVELLEINNINKSSNCRVIDSSKASVQSANVLELINAIK